MRFPRIHPAAAALLLLLAEGLRAGPDEELTLKVATERFEIHARPRTRAAAELERTARLAERDFDRISELLGFDPPGPFRLYLYDDLDDLASTTGVRGTAGFSAGSASHIPFDNDQTRFHEMVHLVAAKLPKSGDEPRSLFHAEGIANALLEFVHGVHVHAVAAFHRRRGELPALAEMAAAPDFYAWLVRHPGINAYDVAASFYRHLLDAHGAAKVKRYYGGATAAKAFGQELAALEKAWWKTLDRYTLRPEVETLLRQRAGEAAPFEGSRPTVPAAILGRAEDWKELDPAAFRPAEPAKWKREGAGLSATNADPAWTLGEFEGASLGDGAVRARIATPSPCPLQIRLGAANQAMLVNGTFLYRDDLPAASSPLAAIGPGRTETDFLLVRRGGRIEIYIDGTRVLEAEAKGGASPVGLGVFQGSATFLSVRYRTFP